MHLPVYGNHHSSHDCYPVFTDKLYVVLRMESYDTFLLCIAFFSLHYVCEIHPCCLYMSVPFCILFFYLCEFTMVSSPIVLLVHLRNISRALGSYA